MSRPDPNDQLTVWRPSSPTPVGPVLAELLDLEPALASELRYRTHARETPSGARIGRVSLELPLPEGVARIELLEEPGSVRFRPELRGMPAALRPRLRALGRAFAERADAAGLSRLAEALGAERRLEEVPDWFHRRITDTGAGRTASLRTGFRCNQNCVFCWQARDWPGPPEALYFQWLDELHAAGVSSLTISGGEPTLQKSLPSLIKRAARDYGMQVHLQTNAIRLRDPKYAAKLREAGLGTLLVSLHSADPEVSDNLTAAPRTFWRTVAGVENALRAGFWVALNCCVERHNAAHLSDHARFVVQRFVEPFADNPLRLVNYSEPGPYYDTARYLKDMAPLDAVAGPLREALSTLARAGVHAEATGTCGFPQCLFLDDPGLVPWVRTGDRDAQDLSARAYPEPCSSCAARPYCVGVRREYVERFGNRGLSAFAQLPKVEILAAPTLAAALVPD